MDGRSENSTTNTNIQDQNEDTINVEEFLNDHELLEAETFNDTDIDQLLESLDEPQPKRPRLEGMESAKASSSSINSPSSSDLQQVPSTSSAPLENNESLGNFLEEASLFSRDFANTLQSNGFDDSDDEIPSIDTIRFGVFGEQTPLASERLAEELSKYRMYEDRKKERKSEVEVRKVLLHNNLVTRLQNSVEIYMAFGVCDPEDKYVLRLRKIIGTVGIDDIFS